MVIKTPTRVTGSTGTLIDNIYTNDYVSKYRTWYLWIMSGRLYCPEKKSIQIRKTHNLKNMYGN